MKIQKSVINIKTENMIIEDIKNNIPVSDICKKYKISEITFYKIKSRNCLSGEYKDPSVISNDHKYNMVIELLKNSNLSHENISFKTGVPLSKVNQISFIEFRKCNKITEEVKKNVIDELINTNYSFRYISQKFGLLRKEIYDIINEYEKKIPKRITLDNQVIVNIIKDLCNENLTISEISFRNEVSYQSIVSVKKRFLANIDREDMFKISSQDLLKIISNVYIIQKFKKVDGVFKIV